MTPTNLLSNAPIDDEQLKLATERMENLQEELKTYIAQGSGPFLAAIYDDKGNLIAKAANSVVQAKCSHNHAEMNTIKQAEEKLNTFDLAPYNLTLYTTAEPCLMCVGGILWSGIKTVFYGVTSKRVEEITGFDEGFKPDWLNEFKKRKIRVYGNIAAPAGEKVLREYIADKKPVYKPTR